MIEYGVFCQDSWKTDEQPLFVFRTEEDAQQAAIYMNYRRLAGFCRVVVGNVKEAGSEDPAS